MQDQVRQAGPPSRDRSPLSRAELRNPPRTYYRRVALGTVLPGAGLLGTRWRVLGALLLAVALAVGGFLVVQLARGGVVRSVLDVAVRPEVLQWLGVALMVGAVVWIGSIVLTAQQSWPGSRGRRGFQVAVRGPRVSPRRRAVGPRRALPRRPGLPHRRGVRAGRGRRVATSGSRTPVPTTRGPTWTG